MLREQVCSKCGEKKIANLHHIYPKKHFGKDGDTIVLCLDCHDEIEVIYGIFEDSKTKRRNYLKRWQYRFIFYNWLADTLWRNYESL